VYNGAGITNLEGGVRAGGTYTGSFNLQLTADEKNLLDNQFSVLAGLYELNSEFYRLQSAGLFLNSSFGIGPEFSQSGLEGPSIFPSTSYMSSQRMQGFPVTSAEKTIEITYLTQLTKRLAVQPDLQYVIHPGTDPTIPNALAFQLRFEISF
jgi:carbohydrate-selective porin OprB